MADFQEMLNDPDYQSLPPERQTAMRRGFYRSVVADPDFQKLNPDKRLEVSKGILFPGAESADSNQARPRLTIGGEFMGGLRDIAHAGDVPADQPRPESSPGALFSHSNDTMMRTIGGALRAGLSPITAPLTNLATSAGEKIQDLSKGTILEKNIPGTTIAPSDIAAGLTSAGIETLGPNAAISTGQKVLQGAKALNNMRPAVQARQAAEKVKVGEVLAERESLNKAALAAQDEMARNAQAAQIQKEQAATGIPSGPQIESVATTAGTAQEQAAKTAMEARNRTAALDAETGKAQQDLATSIMTQRQREARLNELKSATPPNETAVGRVADSLTSAPVTKEEAGKFFQSKYRDLRKAASNEGGALYDQAGQLAGDTTHPRPNLMASVDKLSQETGTLKTSLSSQPQRIARDISDTSLPYREGQVAPTFRNLGKTERQVAGGKSVLAMDDDFYDKYKNYFSPRKPGEPEVFPLELWRDLTSGKMSQPLATVGDMIIDRQSIRAAKRAADSTGHYNIGRQLGMLEDGITKDIAGTSPQVSQAIGAADSFWRDEYIPRFGYKSLPNKASGKSPEDIVNFFFRKETSPSAIQAAESFQKTIQTPSDAARIGRAWLDGISKKSTAKTTGEFSPDAFVNEYLSYPDKVREIAAGGAIAKQQLDDITAKIQEINRNQTQVSELEKTVKEGSRTINQQARDVSRLADTNPTADLETAARTVAKTGKEQAQLANNQAKATEAAMEESARNVAKTGKEQARFEKAALGQEAKVDESGTLSYIGKRAPAWGALRFMYGAIGGRPSAMAQGVMLMTGGEFAQLLASPKGRQSVMNLLSVPAGSKEAVIWGTRANALLGKRSGTATQNVSHETITSPAKESFLQQYGID